MQRKIKIALLWHMHQPLYRNPYTQKFELPWVRLHGLKDYYGMVALLKEFPQIKATYNLVPSLLTQLKSYCCGERDIFQDIFSKEAQKLEVEEIHFLIRHFFSANEKNMINRWPRYRYLYEKKQIHKNSGHTPWEKIFTCEELRDIQVWFQLCYFDDIYIKENSQLEQLFKKSENFNEKDKRIIEDAEQQLLAMIIPEYKKFSDTGQIELSTSPFYHPILPLLLDPQLGRTANPCIPEYDLHFNWEADAIYQLETALEYMENLFEKRPCGLWPSEGSLSMEVLKLLDKSGIKWAATDELNLSHSLGVSIDRDQHFIPYNPGILYKPYQLSDTSISTRIFFRDRHLSDLIGFHYKDIPYEKAAIDMINRIKQSAVRVSGSDDVIVPIILDGENAWEYYPNSGRDFLRQLYTLISEDPNIETVTFSEALQTHVKPGILESLRPGSWVNGNFDIWIGDEEDRKAWKLLEQTKNTFEQLAPAKNFSQERKEKIRECLAIAQGSDWYWWYGKENFTLDLHIFDNLFRKNLQKVYELIEEEAPEELSMPIPNGVRPAGTVIIPPSQPIHPNIDGRIGSYFEWLYAGFIDISRSGGAMNITNPLVNTIYFGFNKQFLYLRIDTKGYAYSFFEDGYSLNIVIKKDSRCYKLPITEHTNEDNYGHPEITSAVRDIIEVSVPLKSIGIDANTILNLQLEWKYNGDFFQLLPPIDYYQIQVPKDKDYAHHWQV